MSLRNPLLRKLYQKAYMQTYKKKRNAAKQNLRLQQLEFQQFHISTKSGSTTLAKRSLGEVAKILGVSRESVRQVEQRALAKLRAGMLPIIQEINPALYRRLMA